MEWYFNVASSNQKGENVDKKNAEKLHQPAMDKQNLEILLNMEASHINALPVRNDILYSPQQLEIKSYYPRAYEYWTDEEYDILKRVYCQCKNVDAVASLLKRQPHIVKEKIESLQMQP